MRAAQKSNRRRPDEAVRRSMEKALLREAGPEITRRLGVQAEDFHRSFFINKNSAGGYTWAPSGDSDGGVVEGRNAGGTGERRTILHALADWRGGGRNRRTSLIRDPLVIVRGLAISRNESPPWFESLNKAARNVADWGYRNPPR